MCNKTGLYCFDDFVYWFTSEALEKRCLGTTGKRFHLDFLVYVHLYMSNSNSEMKDNGISVDQAKYATSIVDNYLHTVTVKTSKMFYKTTFPYNIIFTKTGRSTSDQQVEKLTR